MIKKLVLPFARFALTKPKIRALARQAWEEATAQNSIEGIFTDIPEIGKLQARHSQHLGPRLNLIIPGISPQHFFGGAATAIDLFERLAEYFSSARIIVSDEIKPVPTSKRDSLNWPVCTLDEIDDKPCSIVGAGDRHKKMLYVSKSDVFISTAWWTAQIARTLIDWQDREYGRSNRKLIYLIQDYEPGFYPWSSRWLLADSTYRDPQNTVAVINTSLLADHFSHEGYQFCKQYVFEPRLNLELRSSLEELPVLKTEKKRIILIYGRPNVERNAFELIIMALKDLASQSPGLFERWEVLSVGSYHQDIPLTSTNVVKSLGKLSIKGYAEVLRKTAVGVSLMASPHPSYPPLEMAAFGAKVIANSFGVKDAALIHPNIISLQMVTSSTIAKAIRFACDSFDCDTQNLSEDCDGGFSFPYLSDDDQFEFVGSIIADLQIDKNSRPLAFIDNLEIDPVHKD